MVGHGPFVKGNMGILEDRSDCDSEFLTASGRTRSRQLASAALGRNQTWPKWRVVPRGGSKGQAGKIETGKRGKSKGRNAETGKSKLALRQGHGARGKGQAGRKPFGAENYLLTNGGEWLY